MIVLVLFWKCGCKINGVEIHGNPFHIYFTKKKRGGEGGRLGRRGRGIERQQCDHIGGLRVSDLWKLGSFSVYLQTVS